MEGRSGCEDRKAVDGQEEKDWRRKRRGRWKPNLTYLAIE
jgi:hypothetical protein